MNLNSAALLIMAAKGLSLEDVAEIVRANEVKSDPTAAERQARCRARKRTKSRRDVTRDPPNDNTLTPEVSEANASSPQSWACPPGVDAQVWSDFISNRKRKRQGCSPTAWKRFCDDLTRIAAQTGIPPPKLIEHAAASGWAGIYDPRERSDVRTTKQADGLSSTARAAISVFGSSDIRTIPQ